MDLSTLKFNHEYKYAFNTSLACYKLYLFLQYWNANDPMYSEGRKFVHELEDSETSVSERDLDGNFEIPEIFKIENYRLTESGNPSVQQNSGKQSAMSESAGTQSTIYNTSENQSPILTEEIDENQSVSEKSLENQSGDLKNLQNQSNIVSHTNGDVSSANPSGWIESITNNLPGLPSWFKSDAADDSVKQQLELDARHFMKGVMDECTHLGNFSVPLDPELIIIVSAENDEYIPVKGYLKLSKIWPGSQVRTLPRGHITGFIMGRKEFR